VVRSGGSCAVTILFGDIDVGLGTVLDATEESSGVVREKKTQLAPIQKHCRLAERMVAGGCVVGTFFPAVHTHAKQTIL